MTNSIIDRKTGEVNLNGLKFNLQSSLDEVLNRVEGSLNLTDQRVGWDVYEVRDLEIGKNQITLRLLFYHRRLEIVEFYLRFHNLTEPKTWEEWTPEFESKKHIALAEWLEDQVGGEREFKWGKLSVIADKKGGYSSVVMSKNKVQYPKRPIAN